MALKEMLEYALPELLLDQHMWPSFASLKKQDETLFQLICGERKTLFRLKKQDEKYGL